MIQDKFDLSIEERTIILPEERIAFYKNLIDNFKIFIPELELKFNSLNFDSKSKFEYVIIATHNNNVYIYSPFIYTDSSLPGYRYAVNNNRHRDYFKLIHDKCTKLRLKGFIMFLESIGLSTNSKLPNYWKNTSNNQTLFESLEGMSLQYKPKGFTAKPQPKVPPNELVVPRK